MAIALDTFTNGNYASGTSRTYSHTCTGSDRILFVHVFTNTSSDLITGVTYNGVAMTLVNKSSPNSGRYGYVYVLINPASGANNVVVSASSSTAIGSNAISYTGAKQTGQPDNSVLTTITNATSGTQTLTTVADNCWTVLFITANNNNTTASTGSTFRGVNTTYSTCKIFDSNSAITPAGSTSMSTTNTNVEGTGYHMVSFSPSVTATTNSNFFMFM